MKRILRTLLLSAAALSSTAFCAAHAAPANEQFFPVLVFRSGPYAPNGIPWANGFVDYLSSSTRATAASTA